MKNSDRLSRKETVEPPLLPRSSTISQDCNEARAWGFPHPSPMFVSSAESISSFE
ncbi:MAG: hypothetical protein ACLFNW_06465 [Desulfobacterales bacterium]